MDDGAIFFLVHDTARERAVQAVLAAPDGFVVRIGAPKKTRDQEEKYHAMMGDIAKQVPFMGQQRDKEDWKRLLVDGYARIKAAEGEPLQGHGLIIPSLDGQGWVQLGVQTRSLKKVQASEFIEYLYAFGAEKNVRWKRHG